MTYPGLEPGTNGLENRSSNPTELIGHDLHIESSSVHPVDSDRRSALRIAIRRPKCDDYHFLDFDTRFSTTDMKLFH